MMPGMLFGKKTPPKAGESILVAGIATVIVALCQGCDEKIPSTWAEPSGSLAEVRLVFVDQGRGGEALKKESEPGSVDLRVLERKPRPAGREVKRWPGDAAGKWIYEEREKRTLSLSGKPENRISLLPGFYQIKVAGNLIHGDSAVFEVRPGKPIEVRVNVYFGV